MKYGLKEILDIAEEGKFAIPSFNVYIDFAARNDAYSNANH